MQDAREKGRFMKAALVIMAAGLGSRYGGNKQVDGVGPNGEILLEYAIYDAIRAGFTKIVLVIKPDISAQIGRLGTWLKKVKTFAGAPLEVTYAIQDYGSLPGFYTVPAERTKPFGTVHAVLCAKKCVQEPFCVINADDYYGVNIYRVMYQALQKMKEQGEAAMAGYLLKNTVSANGAVTRGICREEKGYLKEIRETRNICLLQDGAIADLSADSSVVLDPESVVSMNFWGFQPSIFATMEQYFHKFLHNLTPNDCETECLLPVMVGELIADGDLQVRILRADDRWFGMTYQADRKTVAEELQGYHATGIYPPSLRP